MLNRSINDTATSDSFVEFITLTAKKVALNLFPAIEFTGHFDDYFESMSS